MSTSVYSLCTPFALLRCFLPSTTSPLHKRAHLRYAIGEDRSPNHNIHTAKLVLCAKHYITQQPKPKERPVHTVLPPSQYFFPLSSFSFSSPPRPLHILFFIQPACYFIRPRIFGVCFHIEKVLKGMSSCLAAAT